MKGQKRGGKAPKWAAPRPDQGRATLKKPHHRIKVSAAMQSDLSTWLDFLQDFNGFSFWRAKWILESDLQVHLDAAGDYRLGLSFPSGAASARHHGQGTGSPRASQQISLSWNYSLW